MELGVEGVSRLGDQLVDDGREFVGVLDPAMGRGH
jgi:hypothetical protein